MGARFFAGVCVFILACCTLGAHGHLYARDHRGRLFFGTQYHHQYLWAHREEMRPHLGNPVHAFELNLGWQTSGDMQWHRAYNMPSLGLGFFYADLGNPDVFGDVRSGFIYMDFIMGKTASVQRRFKVSLGLSNFSEYYDAETNPENEFIGTRWNVHVNFNYKFHYRISQHVELTPGVSFTHFSNGAYQKPNRGLNLFDVNLGLRYNLGASEETFQPTHDDNLEWPVGEQRLLTSYAIGFMQRNIGDPHYQAHTLTLNLLKRGSYRSRWGLGADFFYDEHAKEWVRLQQEQTSFADYVRAGGFVSYDLVFDRLSLLLNLGVYYYYGYEPENPVYKRIGLRYFITSNVLAHMALKAHFGRADYVAWGLGYAL